MKHLFKLIWKHILFILAAPLVAMICAWEAEWHHYKYFKNNFRRSVNNDLRRLGWKRSPDRF